MQNLIKNFERFISMLDMVVEYARDTADPATATNIPPELFNDLIKEAAFNVIDYPGINKHARQITLDTEAGISPLNLCKQINIMIYEVTNLLDNTKGEHEELLPVIEKATKLITKIYSYTSQPSHNFQDVFKKSPTGELAEHKDTDEGKDTGESEQNKAEEESKEKGFFGKIKAAIVDKVTHVKKEHAAGTVAEIAEEAVKIVANPISIGAAISATKVATKTVEVVKDVIKGEDEGGSKGEMAGESKKEDKKEFIDKQVEYQDKQ